MLTYKTKIPDPNGSSQQNVFVTKQWKKKGWLSRCKFIFFSNISSDTGQTKRLSLIVQVNVVLNRTVFVDSVWRFDNLCGSHLQSQSELYHVSWWYYTLVIDLIGQLCRDVIGRLSVKPWRYWLWRLVISDWCVSIRLLSQLNSRLLLVKLSGYSVVARPIAPRDCFEDSTACFIGYLPYTVMHLVWLQNFAQSWLQFLVSITVVPRKSKTMAMQIFGR